MKGGVSSGFVALSPVNRFTVSYQTKVVQHLIHDFNSYGKISCKSRRIPSDQVKASERGRYQSDYLLFRCDVIVHMLNLHLEDARKFYVFRESVGPQTYEQM